jgi:predicted DsbA family dithiol-disulfide isomerase
MSAYFPENQPIEKEKVLILLIQTFNSARCAH